MIRCVDMSKRRHIPGYWLVMPTIATEQKCPVWKTLGRPKEELFNPRFAVWKPVAEKSKVRSEPRKWWHREVGRRVQAVVDRNTFLGAKQSICIHNRLSSPIREDDIVTWDKSCEQIVWIGLDPVQRCRCINVPEGDQSAG